MGRKNIATFCSVTISAKTRGRYLDISESGADGKNTAYGNSKIPIPTQTRITCRKVRINDSVNSAKAIQFAQGIQMLHIL